MTSMGMREYGYDDNGNLTQDTLGDKTTRYRYTAENRTREIEYSSGSFEGTLYFQYDALQRQNTRVYIPSLNNFELIAHQEHYSYLGQGFSINGVYARQLDEDTRGSAGELQKVIRDNYGFRGTAGVIIPDSGGFILPPERQIQTYQHVYRGSEPVMSFGLYLTERPAQYADTLRATPSLSTGVYFVHDYLGSVRGVSAERGNKLMRIDYDAFGNTTNGYVQRFGYTGKPIDVQSGQYNYGYRHYAPQQARFTTVDPIKDGANWYVYVSNNPINRIDPLGLETAVLSEPVPGGYVHLFIAQRDEETSQVTTHSLHPAKGVIAGLITAIIPGNNHTVEVAYTPDYDSELPVAEAFFDGEELPKGYRHVSNPPVPEGMTQSEFDKLVAETASEYPVDERRYDAIIGPNSNTFVDDVIEGSGSLIPDIPGAQAQNFGEDACEGAGY